MPDISGELGTVSAGTIIPARAVPLSGWFGQRKFATLSGTYGATSVGTIAYTSGNTIWAASPALADVQAAIALASSGDTVIVPAGSGSVTYYSPLHYTKAIKLIGPGKNNLTITSGIGDSNHGIIEYFPANPELDQPWRISGFNLDGAGDTNCIMVENPTYTEMTKGRIDHCGIDYGYYNGIYIYGTVYGVCDNCDFYRFKLATANSNNPEGAYDNLISSYGTYRAWFIEDCNLYQANAWTGDFFENSNACQFVFRYNTAWDVNSIQMMDLHGNNQGTDIPGYILQRPALNAEVYNNVVHSTRTGSSHTWMTQRGGSLLFYNNSIVGDCSNYTPGNSWIVMYDEDMVDLNIPAICTHGGQKYICKADHTSAAITEPGVGANWATYWQTTSLTPETLITWAVGIFFRCTTCYDPAIDTYFYNNTVKGGIDMAEVSFLPGYNTEDYWKEGVNYFFLNPVGRTIKGAVYAPYAYPHPLRSDPIIGD